MAVANGAKDLCPEYRLMAHVLAVLAIELKLRTEIRNTMPLKPSYPGLVVLSLLLLIL